jgi:hypothetical protein
VSYHDAVTAFSELIKPPQSSESSEFTINQSHNGFEGYNEDAELLKLDQIAKQIKLGFDLLLD